METNTLLAKTFKIAELAVSTIDETKLAHNISHIYQQACPELTTKQAETIASLFCEVVKDANSLEEMHLLYKEKIHEPFGLSEPMKECREKRATAIGEQIAELVADSNNPDMPTLDYGAGGGRPAAEITKLTKRDVIAADVDNFLVDGIPETVVFETIHQGKMLPGISDKSAGDAFLSYALHHAEGNGYKEQFNELHRVLADDGKLHILETGIANDNNNFAYGEKQPFLEAQFLDFVTSNFFREEPIQMPVPGNYHRPEKWVDYAKKSGFQLEEMKHTGRDSFGEDCFHRGGLRESAGIRVF